MAYMPTRAQLMPVLDGEEAENERPLEKCDLRFDPAILSRVQDDVIASVVNKHSDPQFELAEIYYNDDDDDDELSDEANMNKCDIDLADGDNDSTGSTKSVISPSIVHAASSCGDKYSSFVSPQSGDRFSSDSSSTSLASLGESNSTSNGHTANSSAGATPRPKGGLVCMCPTAAMYLALQEERYEDAIAEYEQYDWLNVKCQVEGRLGCNHLKWKLCINSPFTWFCVVKTYLKLQEVGEAIQTAASCVKFFRSRCNSVQGFVYLAQSFSNFIQPLPIRDLDEATVLQNHHVLWRVLIPALSAALQLCHETDGNNASKPEPVFSSSAAGNKVTSTSSAVLATPLPFLSAFAPTDLDTLLPADNVSAPSHQRSMSDVEDKDLSVLFTPIQHAQTSSSPLLLSPAPSPPLSSSLTPFAMPVPSTAIPPNLPFCRHLSLRPAPSDVVSEDQKGRQSEHEPRAPVSSLLHSKSVSGLSALARMSLSRSLSSPGHPQYQPAPSGLPSSTSPSFLSPSHSSPILSSNSFDKEVAEILPLAATKIHLYLLATQLALSYGPVCDCCGNMMCVHQTTLIDYMSCGCYISRSLLANILQINPHHPEALLLLAHVRATHSQCASALMERTAATHNAHVNINGTTGGESGEMLPCSWTPSLSSSAASGGMLLYQIQMHQYMARQKAEQALDEGNEDEDEEDDEEEGEEDEDELLPQAKRQSLHRPTSPPAPSSPSSPSRAPMRNSTVNGREVRVQRLTWRGAAALRGQTPVGSNKNKRNSVPSHCNASTSRPTNQLQQRNGRSGLDRLAEHDNSNGEQQEEEEDKNDVNVNVCGSVTTSSSSKEEEGDDASSQDCSETNTSDSMDSTLTVEEEESGATKEENTVTPVRTKPFCDQPLLANESSSHAPSSLTKSRKRSLASFENVPDITASNMHDSGKVVEMVSAGSTREQRQQQGLVGSGTRNKIPSSVLSRSRIETLARPLSTNRDGNTSTRNSYNKNQASASPNSELSSPSRRMLPRRVRNTPPKLVQ